jgi:hypothetical protein
MSTRASSRLASALILLGRVLLLLGAIAAVVTALALGRRSDRDGGGQTDKSASRNSKSAAPAFACPMHPEVTDTSATGCPICGMALEPVRARPRAVGVAETFSVSPTRQSPLFYDVAFARTRPVAREMVAPAWIDGHGVGVAVFFNDEISLLDEREDGAFHDSTRGDTGTGIGIAIGTDHHRAVKIRLTGDPPAPWDRSTSAVRFRITDPSIHAAGEIGDVGWLRFSPRTRPMLAIPYSAVVQSPSGPYVLVASQDRHTFSKRPIKIGRVLFAYATVLDGLREGERIVAMNTFFLDSERRFGQRSAGAPEATP